MSINLAAHISCPIEREKKTPLVSRQFYLIIVDLIVLKKVHLRNSLQFDFYRSRFIERRKVEDRRRI